MTRVSIIMATYNRSQFISEALRSIQNQTYKSWECIIIDDGSSDNTKDIVKEFIKEDPRFKYHQRSSNHKKGLPGCRNQGIELAYGEYIVFFDDDDIVHPQNLEITTGLFRQNIDYIHFGREIFRGNFHYDFNFSASVKERVLDEGIIYEMLTNKFPFNSCQVLWRKSCFDLNKFNEDLMYAEEWECYSRILLETALGISINKILYFGRKHENSNTGEFFRKNTMRTESNTMAILFVLDNLSKKSMLSKELSHFFIQQGFAQNEQEIITYTLKKSNASSMKYLKYYIGFYFYPVLRPLYKMKSKFLSN